jgi:type I restriction enzyme R subunit
MPIEELTEDEATTEQERIKCMWATVEALVGLEKRLSMVAADLVRHFASPPWMARRWWCA